MKPKHWILHVKQLPVRIESLYAWHIIDQIPEQERGTDKHTYKTAVAKFLKKIPIQETVREKDVAKFVGELLRKKYYETAKNKKLKTQEERLTNAADQTFNEKANWIQRYLNGETV